LRLSSSFTIQCARCQLETCFSLGLPVRHCRPFSTSGAVSSACSGRSRFGRCCCGCDAAAAAPAPARAETCSVAAVAAAAAVALELLREGAGTGGGGAAAASAGAATAGWRAGRRSLLAGAPRAHPPARAYSGVALPAVPLRLVASTGRGRVAEGCSGRWRTAALLQASSCTDPRLRRVARACSLQRRCLAAPPARGRVSCGRRCRPGLPLPQERALWGPQQGAHELGGGRTRRVLPCLRGPC